MNAKKIWAIEPNSLIEYLKLREKITSQSFNIDKPQDGDLLPIEVINDWAIVKINGVLLSQPDAIDLMLGGINSSSIVNTVKELSNSNLNGIILKITSPGGEATGLPEVSDQLHDIVKNSNIPIISFIDNLGASGAYWIASQTAAIFSTRSSLIGSIGVLTIIDDISRALEINGIDRYVLKTGELKAIGVGKVDETQLNYLKSIQDKYFSEFINAVQRGRNIVLNDYVLDGKVMLGNDAFKNNLIDDVILGIDLLIS